MNIFSSKKKAKIAIHFCRKSRDTVPGEDFFGRFDPPERRAEKRQFLGAIGALGTARARPQQRATLCVFVFFWQVSNLPVFVFFFSCHNGSQKVRHPQRSRRPPRSETGQPAPAPTSLPRGRFQLEEGQGPKRRHERWTIRRGYYG